MNILVGLSGGVDSAVAAFLLKQKGHNVIGVTMSIWNKSHSDTSCVSGCSHGACYGPNEKEDIETAKKICEQIGIPFYVFDCAKQYEDIVLRNFKEEYLNGRTPNPCIWCNSQIKFQILPYMAELQGIKFDKFATGHYARVCIGPNGRYLLRRGVDSKKDQSYFLYRLKQEQLKNVLFPLGIYTKEEVREIAAESGLPVAQKPDSQDFYEGDYNELLGVEDKIGNIVDKDGKVLGNHRGIWNYTIGQRKGIGISSDEPLYVLDLKKDTNEVVVGFRDKTLKNKLVATGLNWVGIERLETEIMCAAKIRSSQALQNVIVRPQGKSIEIEFTDMQKSISPGQSVVLYQNDIVLGGGVIDKVMY